jgi:2,3-bisphosphoglycerate-dependent phosphoglycerate mutase
VPRVDVLCLRHAESENVLAGASGAVPLAPLTPRGEEQARALRLGVPVAYASTALRARRTAELAAPAVRVRDELVEIGLGAREGVVDAGLRRETADVLRAWVVDGELGRRVADGETGHQVLERMAAGFAAVRDGGEPRVGLVGHVGSLTLAVSALCGLGAAVWGRPLPHAVPFAVRWDGTHWRCPEWP